MEVHAHTHTSDPDPSASSGHRGRKKITHYLWEFLMLFLAVFCGFLAENQREHMIEHQREKQYIQSLISDLKVDKQTLDKQISSMKLQLSMMDSMIVILNNPSQVTVNGGLLYYFARVSPRFVTLAVNNRTYEQLKNSGNFRLIRNLSTSDKIMAYYDKLQLIRQVEGIYDSEFNEYKKIAAKVFDPEVLRTMEQNDGSIARINTNPPLRTNNAEFLKELAVFSIYMNGSRRGLLGFDQDLKNTADELIDYLKKEYHMSE